MHRNGHDGQREKCRRKMMDKEYMLLEAQPLSQADIDLAIKRAHVMRSEAAWNVFSKIRSWVSKQFHSNMTGGSGLAHSS